MNPSFFPDASAPEQMADFLDTNALVHETVFGALLTQGIVTQHYPLWIDKPDESWIDVHYREHLAWSSALNIGSPPDLGAVDFQNETAVQAWLVTHALHHELVSLALGLP